MRYLALVLIALAAVACGGDPIAYQATRDVRHDPLRADTMLALDFGPGAGRLDGAQLSALRAMAMAGRHAQRDEFIVVVDGSGGALQLAYAQQVRQSLSDAGARWVETSRQSSMATGPNTVVVVRSEYRIAARNCPDFSRPGNWNPGQSVHAGFGCSDAYNFGQMLARPRDAAIGRDPGPADATVNAEAIQRYREGRIRTLTTVGSTAGGGAAGAGTSGGQGGAGTGATN